MRMIASGSSNLFNMIQSRQITQKVNSLRRWCKTFLKQDIKFRILVDSERFDEYLVWKEFCKNSSPFELIQMLSIGSRSIPKLIEKDYILLTVLQTKA